MKKTPATTELSSTPITQFIICNDGGRLNVQNIQSYRVYEKTVKFQMVNGREETHSCESIEHAQKVVAALDKVMGAHKL